MSDKKYINGGELLAKSLKEANVEKVFALHGGHLDALFFGCKNEEIELIDFRHEASAGHAADGYARVTGKIGVCVVTSGPGFTNAISAMSVAQLDSIPVLFIIGAPPLREALTNELQGGIDQISMVKATSKWSYRVTNTERIPDVTAMAIRQATTGRKGVAVLEVPIDVLHLPVPKGMHTNYASFRNLPKPYPAPNEIDILISLIEKSQRPAFICGVEATQSRCGKNLEDFAIKNNIPVFMTTRGMGVIKTKSPVNAHQAFNIATMGSNKPDLVILLGQRLGFRTGGRGYNIIPSDTKIVQIHSDCGEIGRIRSIDLAINANCDAVCEKLLDASTNKTPLASDQWLKTAVAAQNIVYETYKNSKATHGIHPFHAMSEVSKVFNEQDIYVLDGGEAASWAAHHIRVDEPGTMIGQGYLGCLGEGPGHAIGAQIAAPNKRVIQITGDGAIGFHIGEFDIMARKKLPVITIILNNKIWGMSLHGQQILYGNDYDAISKLGDTNYANIASAFGCYGERVTSQDEIIPSLRRALDSGLPACIEIMTDPDIAHPVTAAALGSVPKGGTEVMIPYYENIPQHTPIIFD